MPSLWLCGSQQTGKFSIRWEYQTTWPASWEICMQVNKQLLELDIEQWTGSKLGKEYVRAVYYHSAYVTYMQNISYKMPGWMKCKLESRLPGEISIASDMQMTPPLWQKAKRNKEPLDESERGERKSWLKTQHSKNEGHDMDFKPVSPKGNQSWIFIGRTDAEAEAPILWPPDVKSQLTGKDPDSGKDWRQEEEGTTEDEMASLIWWTWVWASYGSGDGQGSLVCYKGSQKVRHN